MINAKQTKNSSTIICNEKKQAKHESFSLQVYVWNYDNACYNSSRLGFVSNNGFETCENDRCRLQC